MSAAKAGGIISKPIAKWQATGKRPNQIAYESTTHRIFSFNSTGRNVTVFDARTGEVLATLDADGRTEIYAMDGKGMICDSLEDKATIIAIDEVLRVLSGHPNVSILKYLRAD